MKAEERKIMVAYFSTRGVTAEVAKKVAEATKGKLFEIQPAQPYTDDDINWRIPDSRCMQERNDRTIRPELLKKAHCPGKYDTFFIGYPVWYGVYPSIVQTFIDSLKLAGKTVVFFCSSGGGPCGKAIDYAKALTKDSEKINFIDDKLLTNASQEEINEWVSSL